MHRSLCLASLLFLTATAEAAPILPGLWEFTSSDVQVDGQQMPGMQEMLEQLKGMSPEQKKMMEGMLAEHGMQLGGQGMRICLSEAQVQAEELPFSDDPACRQEITERSDSVWKFRFECPDARGQGETRFISEREFVSQLETEHSGEGMPQRTRMQSRGRWLGADCGGLKPAR